MKANSRFMLQMGKTGAHRLTFKIDPREDEIDQDEDDDFEETRWMMEDDDNDDNENEDDKEDDDDFEDTRWRRTLPKERSMSIPGEFLR